MYKVYKFELARECLEYLVKTFDIKKINIPYYLCDVVRHTLVQSDCRPIFFHINDDFMPSCEFNPDEYILYPNYFGIFKQNADILASKYPNLIIDNAHAYFEPPQGFACFNAGHKFGFKESYLWISDNNSNDSIKLNEEIKSARQKEFQKLCDKYNQTNLLQINKNSISPFIYPYLANSIKEADELVKDLKKKGKTIYRYWSPLPKSYNEYKFYSRLVPIPIA